MPSYDDQNRMGGIKMNENIDLTKILEGCPKGTEFYHAGYGRVWFKGIIPYEKHPIRLSLCKANIDDYYTGVTVSKKGTHDIHFDGECLLFPSKDQRDWSKFERFWDKPKVEKFDPNTLQPFDKVLVKEYETDIWTASWYSHSANNLDDGWFVCDNTYWHYIIPYNDETKHLVGTKEDCPEYYKWWED